MWNYKRIRSTLYWLTLVAGIVFLGIFARPADADDRASPYFEGHSPWNSGALDARIGAPIGFDGSDDYLLEYTEERERIMEERIDALEDRIDSLDN